MVDYFEALKILYNNEINFLMQRKTMSLSNGRDVIKRHADAMPGTPGVYRMLDEKGNALYIGKAKNLKHRLSSYVNVEAQSVRIQRMIAQVFSVEITTTRSEAEALLLESNLVKKLSPRYNILLKDDKSFPYILFSTDQEFARVSKHRGAKTRKGKYFGPFVSAGAVNDTIALLEKAFLLRSCSDNVFKNRSRPCMLYQIKRCSAPCVGKINKEDYQTLLNQAQAFLAGKSREIQDELVAQMQELSLKMDYEKARVIRDRIKAIAQVQQQHDLESDGMGDADIMALAREGDQACVLITGIRGGRNYGSKSWFPAGTASYSDGDVLAAFIGQYYQNQPAPPLILVSHLLVEAPLIEEALKLNTDYKIEITHPVRGGKRELVLQGVRGAREALTRQLSMDVTRRETLEEVRKLFGLEELPRRIEVYDNSHISGTDAVGAMIVAGQEGFIKTEYRKFSIQPGEITPGDDYAMLRQVLTRRFKKMQEEEGKDAGKIPDLVLIDGGAGQLSTATQVFADLGIQNIIYAGIAKGPDRNAGREQFFLPGKEPFQLAMGTAALHYLQRLRDEAHRFAIGFHRDKRSKGIQGSKLDEIPQIGPGRKKALLHHFGSAREVAAASIADIEKVEGISKSTAKIIYQHFHGEQ
jgi:excinuclease ABC subunit C